MRILVNGWFCDEWATGSGQYLAALVATLPRASDAHEWVLVRPAARGDESPLPPGWGSMRVRTPFDAASKDLAKLWFEQVAFPLACRRAGADVAFVPYWGSALWRPCPVVVTVHDLIPLLLPAYRGGVLQRGYTGLVARTARLASAVLTDSEASRRDIVEHLRIPPERVHAVHLAIAACEPGVLAPESLARVRGRYGLPDGAFLLYLGGFDVRKNVVRTLEGYAKVVERHAGMGSRPPALVIAGRLPAADTPFAPDPRPAVKRLGLEEHVHIIGWVAEEDKRALYALATGAVFLSEYEGFGLPVLEAMACEAAAQ